MDNCLATLATLLSRQLALLVLTVAVSNACMAMGTGLNNNSSNGATVESASTALYGGFDSSMLAGGIGNKIDVSQFTHGNPTLPGKYRVDVYINQQWLGRRDIEIIAIPGKDQAELCVTKGLLVQMGVEFSTLPTPEDPSVSDGEKCFDVEKKIPAAMVDFDSSDLRLSLSIPQLYLSHISRGYVSPDDWDKGIDAGFFSYNLNSFHSSNGQIDSNLFYAGINLGINVDGWRYRYNGSYSTNTSTNSTETAQQNGHWQLNSSYLQHDITSLKSQLTIGDSYSNGDLFDSVSFQGVQIASDDRMLPESQRGYAPVIHGVAETNAKVTVRQGGNVIFETNVPPGEFKIDDMYNSGSSGDFVVTVTEADGRQKQFTVPYSAGVLLLRPGASRYSAVIGKLLNVTSQDAPIFSEVIYQHGLGHGITAYAGGIAAEYYSSAQLGMALNTSLGAIGVDLTRSVTKQAPQDSTLLGRSWRLSYSKVLEQTHTNFGLAAYRYSSGDFLTLSNAALLHVEQEVTGITSPLLLPENSFQVSFSQPISERFGSVYLNGTAQNYWNGAPSAVSYQAGYSNTRPWGTFGASLGRTIDATGIYHNLFTVSFSLPLGNEAFMHRPTLSVTASHGDNQTTEQVALNGTVGENNRFSYNAYNNYVSSNSTSTNSTNIVGAGLQYAAQYGQLSASYSAGEGRQSAISASGALILHQGGLILAPSLGETIGIVYAPGAEGASVINANGGKINRDGYAVIPFLIPYSNNDVIIDPKGSGMNVELDTTSQQIAPRAGAIVLLKYSTTIGRAVLMTINLVDGRAPPLGATVLDEAGKEIGMLAQGGRFFNRKLTDKGRLTVKWGAGREQQCIASYTMPAEAESENELPFQQLTVSCLSDVQMVSTK
ncbi:fimbria/pilus outer membrane usher protein [Solimicrobium silvestre]|uniref:P pilus assembly protein porin PapC n=1 Tax=Solimicrobium silvestre TaxID=2099400 RepID=A0A2S9H069_9BURK|nr:fimbria/pilus outer membrane usher protein [Solimicrobium silvestre]PRC93350.1 P pilus assembly protein porin PapC [Solimicrobium silvestre]